MLLGGLRYLLPVIEAAHRQGYYVITADYLPDNIAHKYSDEYCNVSVIDKEAVLEAAKRLKIDGIMSFAVDPGVVSASYVQNQLGLPSFGPYESVCILQDKSRFRKFLAENNFNVPWAKSYQSLDEALSSINEISFPCIVKPTDSAGSKGVTRVDSEKDLESAFILAFNKSLSKRIIVEEFIEKTGYSSDSEAFSVDGKLKFISYSSQRFDDRADNPYVPAAFSWPSSFTSEEEKYLTAEIQRLLLLLKMNTSIYNIECRVGVNGKTYIMEVSPRGGGNRLAEMVRYATGVDLLTATVCASVGDTIDNIDNAPYSGHWAEIILHAEKDGVFEGLQIDERLLKGTIIETDLWVEKGDVVHSFSGANESLGTLVLNFQNEIDMLNCLNSQRKWLKINVK